MASRSRKGRKRKQVESSVPFAKGFQIPSEKRSERAVGLSESERNRREYQVGEENEFFERVPGPSSIDDWLAQYNEEGQNFKSFLSTFPWLSSKNSSDIKQTFVPDGKTITEKYPEGKVFLQPLGDFEGDTCPNIEELAKYAEYFYAVPVVVLPKVRLEIFKEKDGPVIWQGSEDQNGSQSKISGQPTKRRKSSRIASKSKELEHRWHRNGRIQLRIDSILKALRNNIPSTALCLIGLTMADLYQDDSDLFVAGMAYGNHKVAVFSFARYDPGLSFSKEVWHDIQDNEEYNTEEKRLIMLQRSCKLLVHEMAHLFGVDHCIWYSCCMNGSGHLQEDFANLYVSC